VGVPDYQSLMLPLLKITSDGKEHGFGEVVDALALQFRLTDDDRREMLPSGTQARFENRVRWAQAYMKKAGLLENPRRGKFRITDRGARRKR
jgi:restriction system protein